MNVFDEKKESSPTEAVKTAVSMSTVTFFWPWRSATVFVSSLLTAIVFPKTLWLATRTPRRCVCAVSCGSPGGNLTGRHRENWAHDKKRTLTETSAIFFRVLKKGKSMRRSDRDERLDLRIHWVSVINWSTPPTPPTCQRHAPTCRLKVEVQVLLHFSRTLKELFFGLLHHMESWTSLLEPVLRLKQPADGRWEMIDWYWIIFWVFYFWSQFFLCRKKKNLIYTSQNPCFF